MTTPKLDIHPSVSRERVDLVVRLVALGDDADARYAIICAAASLLGAMAGKRGEADIDAALAGFREVARDAMLAHLPPGGRA